ncbi:MAG: hypothetical protein KDK78_07165 [Chlamydiia bacterium]|nr:hypothetical protein [Chlamydiia bacterium]
MIFNRPKRRPFLLLEILIAVALCALALIPLLQPHFAVLAAQRDIQRELRFEQEADRLFAVVLEDLYENRVSWSAIQDGTNSVIDSPIVREARYEGIARIEIIASKGKEGDAVGAQPHNLLLVYLLIQPSEEESKRPVYSYEQKVYVHVQAAS